MDYLQVDMANLDNPYIGL
jgi:hypothetical protein